MDMQLLTLMNDGVPLIKSSIYLSMDGIDKLLEKIGSYDTMSSRDDAVRNVVQEISDTAKAGMNDMKDPAAWGNAGSGSTGGSGGGSGGGSSGKVDLSKPDESGKVDLSKDKSALDSISEFLGDWTYSQYIWLLLCFRPNEIKLERTADLIQMEMSKKRQVSGDIGPFLMKDAYTYVRVDVRAQTVPLLPIPTVPGANGHGLNLEKVYYGGY
ncbi:hypothetical protein [Clostridium sp. AM58-1XD]|uniref:hypothetical protein n=1 Tax=Clostridium sp. AM58-1XD TaxID=2292307 RepID=UPI000E4BADCD|nr:hypothetical protein [Clostridium sp. AM58-1XD]RGZ01886.1 hypothetical protein DXA13_00865 [Clostridium sp. AM58-1XD]